MTKRWMALLAATLLSFGAHADSWRVDIVLVKDRNYGFSEQEKLVQPSLYSDGEAIPLDASSRLAAQGIRILPEDDSVLRRQWSRLANSQRFDPVFRLAWVQDNPPRRDGPALLLRRGNQLRNPSGMQPIHEWEGTLRLTLRRFLHLHANIEWRQSAPSAMDRVGEMSGEMAGLGAMALREERRMRSKTLHYLDGPGFGVLVHVLPLDSD